MRDCGRVLRSCRYPHRVGTTTGTETRLYDPRERNVAALPIAMTALGAVESPRGTTRAQLASASNPDGTSLTLKSASIFEQPYEVRECLIPTACSAKNCELHAFHCTGRVLLAGTTTGHLCGPSRHPWPHVCQRSLGYIPEHARPTEGLLAFEGPVPGRHALRRIHWNLGTARQCWNGPRRIGAAK